MVDSIILENFKKSNIFKPEHIPPELTGYDHWVVWKAELAETGQGDHRVNKIPFTPGTRTKAKANDPATWGSYEAALKHYRESNGLFDGIGFELGESGVVGIDLDSCVDAQGNVEAWALEIIRAVDSYTEISPSGTGIRILCFSKLPPGGRKKGKLEIYDTGRFLTVTGKHVEGTPGELLKRKREIMQLHEKVFQEMDHNTPGLAYGDDELIKKAMSAKNGETFCKLYNGELAGYPSHSEADLAFCNMLAFWTGRDAVRMEQIIRGSKRSKREKWDKKHYADGRTYGQETIAKAIDSTKETYEPKKKVQEKPQEASGRIPEIICMANVEPVEVSFLWDPFIPFGKLTLMDGDPSVGKTFLALQLAACISTGAPLPGPDGVPRERREPGKVLYMTAEDGIADTIRPRLDKMNADPTNIFILEGWHDPDIKERGHITLQDVDVIEKALAKVKPVMVVVDPIQGYLGAKVNMHRSNEVRPVLRGLADLGEKYGAAMLCIRHLNKVIGGKAIYRGLGSIDFAAAARSMLLVGQDPDDAQKRAIIHMKSSLAGMGPSIAYELRPPDGFFWAGLSSLNEAKVLAAPDDEEKGSLEEAEEFIVEMLKGGPAKAQDVYNDAKKNGISERTLNRAKKNLGVKSVREDNIWIWRVK